MNYTINYPGSVPVHQSQQVPVRSPNQRAIVLTPPSQSIANVTANLPNCNPGQAQPAVPVVMQVGQNPPVFYTYQNTENFVNPGIVNKSTENGNASNTVLLSSVQRGMNVHHGSSNSPTLPAVNVTTDNKPCVAKSLNDMFNMQAISGISNQIPATQIPATQTPQPHPSSTQNSTDLAGFLSSLQAAGIQLIENPSANNGIAIVNTSQQQATEVTNDKVAMGNFMSVLQSSGVPVENTSDKTLAISLPCQPMEETNIVPGPTIPADKVYQIVDGGGNVTLISAGSNESPEHPTNGLHTRRYIRF